MWLVVVVGLVVVVVVVVVVVGAVAADAAGLAVSSGLVVGSCGVAAAASDFATRIGIPSSWSIVAIA